MTNKRPTRVKRIVQENLEAIKEMCSRMTDAQVAAHFGIQVNSLKKYKQMFNIQRKDYHSWTVEEHQFILDNYKSMGNTKLAKAMGKTRCQMDGKMRLLGLKRTPEEIEAIKSNTSYIRVKTINREGQLFKYQSRPWWYTVVEGKKVPYHYLVYERNFGKVPSGHILVFLDGDFDNLNPSNLAAMTRSDAAKLFVKSRSGFADKYRQTKEKNRIIQTIAQQDAKGWTSVRWLQEGYRLKKTQWGTIWE